MNCNKYHIQVVSGGVAYINPVFRTGEVAGVADFVGAWAGTGEDLPKVVASVGAANGFTVVEPAAAPAATDCCNRASTINWVDDDIFGLGVFGGGSSDVAPP
jgi:hypothetical protein